MPALVLFPMFLTLALLIFFLFDALYLDDLVTPLLALSDILSSLKRYHYPPLLLSGFPFLRPEAVELFC